VIDLLVIRTFFVAVLACAAFFLHPFNLDGPVAAAVGAVVGAGVVALARDAVIPQLLIKENNVTQPFWSPDSRSVAFYENDILKRVDIGGGPAQIIADAPPPHFQAAHVVKALDLDRLMVAIHREERRHAKLPGSAASVRQPRDRANGLPQPATAFPPQQRGHDCVEAVAIPIHGMP